MEKVLDYITLSYGPTQIYTVFFLNNKIHSFLSHLYIVRSTISELCVRGNGLASAMCSQISPLGVCVRFGTMQVAGLDLLPMVVLAGLQVRHP